jgi:hypothetical protein
METPASMSKMRGPYPGSGFARLKYVIRSNQFIYKEKLTCKPNS